MQKDDWTGLGVSIGTHLLALLFVGTIILGSKNPEPQVRLLQIEFGSIASSARPSAPSDNPDPRPPQPEQDPTTPREQVATQTPVQPPRTQSSAQLNETITRPQQNDTSQPDPPNPSIPDRNTDGGGGSPDGETGQDNNPDNSDGQGNEGTSGVAVEGLGSRSAQCRRPAYPGVSGIVSYLVTFAPDGSYIRSRPNIRGGDQRLDDAVRRVISTCRAARLPSSADQVEQTGTVTFRFRN